MVARHDLATTIQAMSLFMIITKSHFIKLIELLLNLNILKKQWKMVRSRTKQIIIKCSEWLSDT